MVSIGIDDHYDLLIIGFWQENLNQFKYKHKFSYKNLKIKF